MKLLHENYFNTYCIVLGIKHLFSDVRENLRCYCTGPLQSESEKRMVQIRDLLDSIASHPDQFNATGSEKSRQLTPQ